jgi:nitroimidazol reductase NimA-like FMN-containing flavoprotein (pyridoxamine 5'-phosphate oxidase superfamily)
LKADLVAMRPRDLTFQECEAILSKSRYGRLGLCADGKPYVVPMSYVYSPGRIFLHSRSAGKKVDLAQRNQDVCFQVDLLEKSCWSSVIAYGKARLSSDREAKRRMFESFTARDLQGHGGKAFSREDLEKMEMTIWEIEVEEMTGREGLW